MKITKLTNKSKLAVVGIVFLTIGFLAPAVQARDWWGEAQEGGLNQIGETAFQESGTPNDIRVVAANIIKAFLGLFGTIFVIIIVVGGFKWMTSGGDKEKVATAQKYLTNGILGLFVTLAAFAIALYVTRSINSSVDLKAKSTSQALIKYHV